MQVSVRSIQKKERKTIVRSVATRTFIFPPSRRAAHTLHASVVHVFEEPFLRYAHLSLCAFIHAHAHTHTHNTPSPLSLPPLPLCFSVSPCLSLSLSVSPFVLSAFRRCLVHISFHRALLLLRSALLSPVVIVPVVCLVWVTVCVVRVSVCAFVCVLVCVCVVCMCVCVDDVVWDECACVFPVWAYMPYQSYVLTDTSASILSPLLPLSLFIVSLSLEMPHQP